MGCCRRPCHFHPSLPRGPSPSRCFRSHSPSRSPLPLPPASSLALPTAGCSFPWPGGGAAARAHRRPPPPPRLQQRHGRRRSLKGRWRRRRQRRPCLRPHSASLTAGAKGSSDTPHAHAYLVYCCLGATPPTLNMKTAFAFKPKECQWAIAVQLSHINVQKNGIAPRQDHRLRWLMPVCRTSLVPAAVASPNAQFTPVEMQAAVAAERVCVARGSQAVGKAGRGSAAAAAPRVSAIVVPGCQCA